MLYLIYSFCFILVMFVFGYINDLIVPLIQPYFPNVNTIVLDIIIQCIVILPIVILLLRTQKIVARNTDIRTLQLKIGLIGAVPLVCALILILLFFQSAFERYTNSQQLLEIAPVHVMVDETITDIDLLRDSELHDISVDESIIQAKLNSIASNLELISIRLDEFPFVNYERYQKQISLALIYLYDNYSVSSSDQSAQQRFSRYTDAINALNNLRHELNFDNLDALSIDVYYFINELESLYVALRTERTLLSEVFERGFFLALERDMFLDTRSTIRNLRLELENTTNLELLDTYNAYAANNLSIAVEQMKENLVDESHSDIIRNINQLLGYGGAIHNFKNYIIRRDDIYLDAFKDKVKGIETNLTLLRNKFPDSQRLAIQIDNIMLALNSYLQRVELVTEDKMGLLSVEQLDEMMRVDDSEAINALTRINQLEVFDFPVTKWRSDTNTDVMQLQQLIDSVKSGISTEMQEQINDATQWLIILFCLSVFLILVSAVLGINITSQVIQAYKLQRELKKQAEQATVAKSQFLANMSHEIRTPMNGIVGLMNMLRQTRLDEQQQKYLNHVEQSSQSLMRIINDILDLSKLEANKLVLEQQPVEIRPFFEHLYHLYAAICDEKRLGYQLQFADDLPFGCKTDPVRLQQIVSNLLSNAVKFTEDGRVSLKITTQHDRLTIAVTDTGIGMSEEQQANIFRRFEQADASTSRRYGGTGLGVNIVKEIVELMDGELQLHSYEGEGTTFIVHLPTTWLDATDFDTDDAEEQSAAEVDFSALTVLIVEDNTVNLMVAKSLLKNLGISTIHHAENGQIALDTVNDLIDSGAEIDLILMDCQMPVMDGYAASEALRAQNVDIPIVALTANALKGDKEKCLAAGMNDFVAKPIDKAHLEEVIRRWAGRVV